MQLFGIDIDLSTCLLYCILGIIYAGLLILVLKIKTIIKAQLDVDRQRRSIKPRKKEDIIFQWY